MRETCALNNINSNLCHVGHLKVGQKDWNLDALVFSNLKEERSLFFQGCEKGDGCDDPGMLGLLGRDTRKSPEVVP